MPHNPLNTTLSSGELEELLKEACNISTARQFQLECGLDLVNKKDLFLVAAPGMGKTIVMAAPLIAAQKAESYGIALVVVPTKTLTEQQVNEWGTVAAPEAD